jgi:hypothetical protein
MHRSTLSAWAGIRNPSQVLTFNALARGALVRGDSRKQNGSLARQGCRDAHLDGINVAKALRKQEYELSEDERFIGRARTVYGLGQVLIDPLQVLEGHHGALHPSSRFSWATTSLGASVRQRPAMCRSGRSR